MNAQQVPIASASAITALAARTGSRASPFRRALDYVAATWTTVTPALPTKNAAPQPADPYREIVLAAAPERSGEIGRALVESSYAYVGARTEHTILGSFTTDAFVHPQGLATVHVRSNRLALDPGVESMPRYWIETFFEDGTFASRAGTNAIGADVDAHLEDVVARASTEDRAIIAVRTISDVKRLSDYFHARCTPLAATLELFALVAITFALFVAMLVRVFFWVHR